MRAAWKARDRSMRPIPEDAAASLVYGAADRPQH